MLDLANDDDDDDTEDDGEGGDLYEVERIVTDRRNPLTGEREFLVKWKGYPENESTWEPSENLLGAEGVLESYDHAKKVAAGKAW